MDKIKVYQPEYYKKFSCSGSTCKYSCCCGWQIDIDKRTYDKYMCLDDDVKKDIIDKLKLINDGKKVAQILLDKTGSCQFLTESRLCSLQLKFGITYLSEVCWYYPRIFCQVGGSFERFLDLSCEEAAKLILLDKKYMNFEEIDLEPDPYNDDDVVKFAFHIITDNYTKATNAIDIFWKLRVATVAILQSRQYKIRFRMLLLCLFMQEINELFISRRESEAIICTDGYLSRLESKFYDELNSQMPNGIERDMSVTIDILKEMFNNKTQMKDYIEQAFKGFDIYFEDPVVPDGVSENCSRYYDMYFADKEYIFENYLVHRVLSEGFPFNYKNKSSLMDNYVDLLAKYNIVEFLFTGICRVNMKFDKRKIIDCISIFTRGYEHSNRKYLL